MALKAALILGLLGLSVVATPSHLCAQALFPESARESSDSVAGFNADAHSSLSHARSTNAADPWLLFAAGATGGVLGLVGGGIAGFGIGQITRACEYCGLGFGLLGAAVGEALGVPLGVHLANGGKGRLALTFLGSVAATAAGIWLLSSTTNDGLFNETWSLVVPVAQIGTAVYVETATTPDRPVPVPIGR